MGIFCNGNQWDVVAASGVGTTVVNGLNIGTGTAATFIIPANFHLQTKQFDVCSNATSCTVSGIGYTINGGATPLTVSALTGKTLYNLTSTNWISF